MIVEMRSVVGAVFLFSRHMACHLILHFT